MNQKLKKKMAENLVLGLILTYFDLNLITRYHGQLSSCTISENTNDRIL